MGIRMPRPIITLLLVLSPALCPIRASAGWSSDPSTNTPVDTVAACEQFPVLASDGAGGMFVVWSSYRAGSAFVFAQHFDPSGNALWPADGIALSSSPGGQTSPQMIPDGSGGAIVSWGNFCPMRAQRIDGEGSLLWGQDGIVLSAANGPAVLTPDGTGGAILAWAEPDSIFHTQVHVQRINGAGVTLWAPGGIPLTSGLGYQHSVQVVPDGSGGAIITWNGNHHGVFGEWDDDNIVAQRMDAQGDRLWGADNLVVCSAPGLQQYATLIADGVGGAVVAWEDSRDAGNGHSSVDIYAQRLNPSGAALWSPDGAPVCTAAGLQYGVRLAPDGAAGAMLAWNDQRSDSVHVFMQHVDSSGIARWAPDGVGLFSGPAAQVAPCLVADGSGGVFVAWMDHRSGEFDIYGQHMAANGAELVPHGGSPLSTAGGDQYTPTVAWDGRSGAVAVWGDTRSGAMHVYAQGVQFDQLAAVGSGAVPRTTPPVLSLSLAGPNPILGHGEIGVRFTLPASTPATLDLVDALGRRIASVDLSPLGQGTHTTTLAGERRLSPGVYFVRLHQGHSIGALRVAVLD